jgi:hypothetical protein
MTEYLRKQAGYECPPPPDDPADQPKAPTCECEKLPNPQPPSLKPPDPCPPTDCDCPDPSGPTSTCFDRQVDELKRKIARGEKAKASLTEINSYRDKAKAAGQTYTRDTYEKLLKQWRDQDRDIANLVRTLVCTYPCWRCIVECYVCPLLNDLHLSLKWLYGDSSLYKDVHNLYDLQYWQQRDFDRKTQIFKVISGVLGAWTDPAKTIQANLNGDAALIANANKTLGTDARTVYDVFFRLIPMHLAIAPPASPENTTRIAKEYTEFCECDSGTADDCCGPDVGDRSLRQKLIGPQAYLIHPSKYDDLICCLLEKRYQPAEENVTNAQAALQRTTDEITRRRTQLDNYAATFDNDAKARIPSQIVCCDDQLPPTKSTPTTTSA